MFSLDRKLACFLAMSRNADHCMTKIRRVHSHHDLEAVEAFGLGALHLRGESLDQVFIDDAIGLGRSPQ